jgi:phosphatidylglycerophosphate synthase
MKKIYVYIGLGVCLISFVSVCYLAFIGESFYWSILSFFSVFFAVDLINYLRESKFDCYSSTRKRLMFSTEVCSLNVVLLVIINHYSFIVERAGIFVFIFVLLFFIVSIISSMDYFLTYLKTLDDKK